ncbi:MAG: response regulator [Bacteroidota bacterium]|nr:response regulator [Bacteroidota bacterium]
MNKIKILFVDDEADALLALKIGMEDRGYEVFTAGDGNTALETLKSVTPDIIIADLRMMPMNGFELFQEVKKIPNLVNIPFFFLTAIDDYLAQKYGQTLGVDAYVTKPVELEHLDNIIKQKIKKE